MTDCSGRRGAITLPSDRLQIRKEHLLREVDSASERLPAVAKRRPGRLWVALSVVALVLAAGGTAYAIGAFDWLAQQNRLDSPGPGGPPALVGKRIVFASSATWAAVAWRSHHGLCIDIATRGNSGNGCGFPVPGAASPREPSENLRLAAGVSAGSGPGYLLSAGVAVPEAARVDIGLADGRVLQTSIADAPAALDARVRLFWVRYPWTLPVGDRRVVERYVVYDAAGVRIGTASG
jgi:hypothetical protein